MKELKRPFFNFFGALLVLIVISSTIVVLIDKPNFTFMKGLSNSWSLFIFLFIIAFLQGQVIKRDLNQLREFKSAEGLFNKYTQFYKKRLLLNFIPVFFCAILFVLTFRNIFFYLLLTQIAFSFVFFPRKEQILRDLPGREIVFE
jgi:hypothetical protein